MAEYKFNDNYINGKYPDYEGINDKNEFVNFNSIKPYLKVGDKLKFIDDYNSSNRIPHCSITDNKLYVSDYSSVDYVDAWFRHCLFDFYGYKVKFYYNYSNGSRYSNSDRVGIHYEFELDCRNISQSLTTFLFGKFSLPKPTNLNFSISDDYDREYYSSGRIKLVPIINSEPLINLHDRQILATSGSGSRYVSGNDMFYNWSISKYQYGKSRQTGSMSEYDDGGTGFYGGYPDYAGSYYLLTNDSEKPNTYMQNWQDYSNIMSNQNIELYQSSLPTDMYIEIIDIDPNLKFAEVNYYVNDELYKKDAQPFGNLFNNIIPPLPSPAYQFIGWSDRDNNQILTENSIINKAVCNVNAIFIEYDNYHYFPYSGKMESMTLDPGSYKLIVAGAQGAKGANETATGGGFGGYSEGTLELKEPTKIFVYAGGQPDYDKSPGGFNGGGRAGYNDYTKSYYYPAGGGASDIRLGQDSLYARVIVAGGGGGDSGSYGGGLTSNQTVGSTKYQATQTGGYQFGIGRDAPSGGGSGYSGTESGPGAGGGGWYGGDHSNYTTHYGGAGNASGGSGYIYTAESAKNYPSGCLLNEKYYLKDAFMYDGSGTKESTKGNLGHGYAYVITNETGDFKISQINYYNDGVLYKTASYKIGKTPKEVILPDKGILIRFNGWIDKDTGAKFNEKSPLEKEIYNLEAQYKELEGFEFSYTGKVQEQDLKPGIYKIKMYGAQGGNYDDKHQGGLGGYSEGTLELKEPTKIFVYVGGQPAKSTSYGQPGGFNGGGKSGYSYYSDKTYGQAGGGASDIRIGQDSLYARVIVAGGGAGGNNHQDHKLDFAGGGEVSKGYSGYTANQTSGYQFGVGQNGYNGGNYRYTSGGAGGGWYGGKSYQSYSDSTRYDKYSAGGSGYVYTAETAKNYPSGCLLNDTHYLTEAQTVAGDINGREGNGSIAIIDLTPPSESLSVLNLYKNGAFKSTNANIYKTDKFQTCNVFKYINGEFKKI